MRPFRYDRSLCLILAAQLPIIHTVSGWSFNISLHVVHQQFLTLLSAISFSRLILYIPLSIQNSPLLPCLLICLSHYILSHFLHLNLINILHKIKRLIGLVFDIILRKCDLFYFDISNNISLQAFKH